MTTTSGGTSTTYNVTTMVSSYGTSGTGTGTSADSSGDGSSDSDSDDGDGDDDDDGDDYGTGAETEDLYTKTDKTVESLASNFYSQASSLPVVSGITNFMSVPSGGSCPTFTVSQTDYWKAMTFDAHCEGTFLSILQAGGYLVFAFACYIAIRIAVT